MLQTQNRGRRRNIGAGKLRRQKCHSRGGGSIFEAKPLARDDAGWEPIIALVRGTDRVDIARLASVTGKARMRRATAREATDASGFSIGGIPPFGHRQRISVVMDPALDAYPEVWAAAGTANAVFAIAPATLAMLSDALVAPCTEVEPPAADET